MDSIGVFFTSKYLTLTANDELFVLRYLVLPRESSRFLKDEQVAISHPVIQKMFFFLVI